MLEFDYGFLLYVGRVMAYCVHATPGLWGLDKLHFSKYPWKLSLSKIIINYSHITDIFDQVNGPVGFMLKIFNLAKTV